MSRFVERSHKSKKKKTQYNSSYFELGPLGPPLKTLTILMHFTCNIYLPEFLKTGLVKIRAHFTTWQLKAIKSVQRPIKKPISDAEQ